MFDAVRTAQPSRVTIAAWNVQRGGNVREIAAKLRDVGASVVLLSECDVGMARSGNVDTVAEIAQRLGMGHAFAVEFKELGLGNQQERERCAGMTNGTALHGNAVLSRRPFQRSVRIALDSGSAWEGSSQPRIGGRCALATEIDGLWFVSAHLEARGNAGDRAAQMQRLVSGLNQAGASQCVVGGDFNTREPNESLVNLAKNTWLDPIDYNGHEGRFQGKMLDWFFVRGIPHSNPRVHDGSGISDHDLITVDIAL